MKVIHAFHDNRLQLLLPRPPLPLAERVGMRVVHSFHGDRLQLLLPIPPLPPAYPEGIKERVGVRVVPMFHERSRKPSVQQPRAIHAAGGAECPGALAE